MTNEERFDAAFGPTARLLGSVRYLSNVSCLMTDGGEELAVTEFYCAFCNAIHGHAHDGEADCIHKRVLQLALELRQVVA